MPARSAIGKLISSLCLLFLTTLAADTLLLSLIQRRWKPAPCSRRHAATKRRFADNIDIIEEQAIAHPK